MPIQASSQPLLVKIMSNQANAPSQHKQAVENAHRQVIFSLFWAECAAVAHQINEADCNTTINVQNEVILLGRGDSLNSNGVVEHFAVREALLDEFFDQLYTEIRIVAGFDFVANARDCRLLDGKYSGRSLITHTEFVLFPHGVDKVAWAEPLVEGFGKLLRSAIERASES